MAEEKLKPLLIDFDGISFERDQHLLKMLIQKHGPAIERAFVRLDIGPLTDEDLQEILSNDLVRIKDKLMDHVRSEVKSKYLLQPAIDKANTIFARLEEVSEDANKTIYHYAIGQKELLSVNDKGSIVLTNEAKEELRECHQIFLHTENGQKRYKAHLKAAKAIQTFVDEMEGIVSPGDALDYFDVDEKDKIFPIPLNCYE